MAAPDAVDLAEIAGWVRGARSVVVLTGAGISTESASPTSGARTASGRRTPRPRSSSTLQHYVADPEVRRGRWQTRLEHRGLDGGAQRRPPGPGRAGAPRHACTRSSPRTSTGSTSRPGVDPDRVVEIHGTIREVTCLSCGERAPMERALDRVRAGEDDPPCRSLRRHPQVGHDLVRPEPRARRPRCGPTRPPRRRATCSWPSARRSPCTRSPHLPEIGAARPAPASSSSTPSPPRSTPLADAVVRGSLGEVLPRSSPWSERPGMPGRSAPLRGMLTAAVAF